jgi:hypothetical protein
MFLEWRVEAWHHLAITSNGMPTGGLSALVEEAALEGRWKAVSELKLIWLAMQGRWLRGNADELSGERVQPRISSSWLIIPWP